MRRFVLVLLGLLSTLVPAAAQALPAIAKKAAGLQRMEGFLPLYWDAEKGHLYMEIDQPGTELIYAESLATGVGLNAAFLDRGQPGESQLVRFDRVGSKVLLVAENPRYRADSSSESERTAVRESFPESVLWGFLVAASDGPHVLVDATDFFLHDSHRVGNQLQQRGQGSWHLDASRCAIFEPHTRSFPRNTEVEATLTFTSDKPTGDIDQVTPSSGILTVRAHSSFFRLPDRGYTPRAYDPRCGLFVLQYSNYAAPLTSDIEKRFVTRFRLQQRDGVVTRPITFYVDRGTPEPIRSALLEGIGWWSSAFEAAGFHGAFKVDVLPAGVDPLDARYNVVEWVPRTTTGWSYGTCVVDPRSGEIVNAHVTLDALRVRRVMAIAKGLLGRRDAALLEQIALSRVRQLGAHEVGHSLGLMHNFAASIGPGSVMDYPPPVATLDATGRVELSHPYGIGVGAWDQTAIAYGYTQFPAGTDEAVALATILQGSGPYLSDADARGAETASPIAHLWDSGSDPLTSLHTILSVRESALRHLNEEVLEPTEPTALLGDVLVGVYMVHVPEVTATVKLLGGVEYAYRLPTTAQPSSRDVDPDRQQAALRAVLETLSPESLAVPSEVLAHIDPRPPGYEAGEDSFFGRTSPVFDPCAPAEAYAETIVPLLLNPQRAVRMTMQHGRTPQSPSFAQLLQDLLRQSWSHPGSDAIEDRVASVVLRHVVSLAADEDAPPEVRGEALIQLQALAVQLEPQANSPDVAYALQQIHLLETDPQRVRLTRPPRLPVTTPMGEDDR